MGRRRGIIAEWQHQSRLQEQQRRRNQAAAERAHRQALREAEKAKREADRARAAQQRAAKAQRVAAEREAAEKYKAQMHALAEVENTRLSSVYADIDSLLEWTLGIDDYVDLDALTITPKHPAFDPGSLDSPTPEPSELPVPAEPTPQPVKEPSAFVKLFTKKKYEQAKLAAHQQWVKDHQTWHHHVHVDIPAENERLRAKYREQEDRRHRDLAAKRAQYDAQCAERDNDAAQHNARVRDLAERLGRSEPEAINEYVGIVLSNSVYPEAFPVEHDYTFDIELGELELTATVPAPTDLPTTKHVRYIASADELRETALSQKDQRTRYNNAVYSVALRTLHEVFEADRDGKIASISLSVRTSTISPATGNPIEIDFVRAAADRKHFLQLNLADVEPLAALNGLSAEVSKNPFGLVELPSSGVSVRR